jgi:hypothetical protein
MAAQPKRRQDYELALNWVWRRRLTDEKLKDEDMKAEELEMVRSS